jgi:steroid delta-isomerase-like uncharacterized protein
MTNQHKSLLPFGLTRRAVITRLGVGGLAMVAAHSHGSVAQERTSVVVEDLPPAIQEYITGWAALDVEQIVGAFAEDAVVDDVAAGVIRTGQEAIRAHVTATVAAFAELQFQVVAAVAAGDMGALEWTLTGRYTGMLPGLPPGDGQPVAVRGAHALEVTDGRIQVSREYADRSELLLQLGLVWPTAGYAGQVDGTEALIAFVTDGSEIRAYVCDGQEVGVTLSEWFRGTAGGAEIDLPSTSGQAQLTATLTPAAVTGTVVVADQAWSFTALPARDGSGLYAYRGGSTAALLNRTGTMATQAQVIRAGWVVSNPEGEALMRAPIGEPYLRLSQRGIDTDVEEAVSIRGAVAFGDVLRGNQALDVATRTATIAGRGQVLTGLVTSTNMSRFFTNGWP